MSLLLLGLMLGGGLTICDSIVWDEILIVLGNSVGGISLTGLALYRPHVLTQPLRKIL